MPRLPDDCRFRLPIESVGRGAAICQLVTRALGVTDPDYCIAHRDACEACCRHFRPTESINPVVASLVYNAAARIVSAGGHPECSVDRARQLRQCAIDQLGVIVGEFPDRRFPPESVMPADRPALPAVHPAAGLRQLTWAVGLLTAPREERTIIRTLHSLRRAGFDVIHVFAEPRSWIPPEFRDLPVTHHKSRLGNFLNFYSSLSQLLDENPLSDAFAVFQDDIEAASGLKEWCDRQLWPLGAGVVSLFTPRLHSSRTPGWRLLSPGFQRACGAQGLVFRRDTLQQFLSDPLVIRSLQARDQNDDAVVAGWVAREGTSIAYHTPSLIQHIGEVSSIYTGGPDRRNVSHAVSSTDQIDGWNPPAGRPSTGLVGWNTPTGLGYLNRDLADHFEIKRWLIPKHPERSALAPPACRAQIDILKQPPDDRKLRKWLEGLDWVLFVERPYLDNLARVAAHSGVGVACVPMWEWVQPDLEWLAFVDLMLCPTRIALQQMTDWKKRYGFGWEAVYIPWPIDTERFRFRQRQACRRFLFVNGWGGGIHRLDGSSLAYRRKGFELIVEAARLAPKLEFVVYSQEANAVPVPGNIEMRPAPIDNLALYQDCDVCVQPSHYEGLGLQLLECQAAGMPLVTTDAAPMNEYNPFRMIPVCGAEVITVGSGPISSQLMRPRDLVALLEPLVHTDIREASRAAREFVVARHSWNAACGVLREALTKR